jgi:transcriptional regulator with XRE-family HTH domain
VSRAPIPPDFAAFIEPKPSAIARSRWNAQVANRLRRIADGLTFREIAECTGMNPETVRRYMRGGNPCIRFVFRFCQEFGTSADAVLGLASRALRAHGTTRTGTRSVARTTRPPRAVRRGQNA